MAAELVAGAEFDSADVCWSPLVGLHPAVATAAIRTTANTAALTLCCTRAIVRRLARGSSFLRGSGWTSRWRARRTMGTRISKTPHPTPVHGASMRPVSGARKGTGRRRRRDSDPSGMPLSRKSHNRRHWLAAPPLHRLEACFHAPRRRERSPGDIRRREKHQLKSDRALMVLFDQSGRIRSVRYDNSTPHDDARLDEAASLMGLIPTFPLELEEIQRELTERSRRSNTCGKNGPEARPYPGTGHEIVGNRPVEGSFTDRSRLLHGRPTRGRPVRTPLSLSVLIPWMGGWVAKRAAAPGARQAPGTRGANGRTRRNRSPSRSR